MCENVRKRAQMHANRSKYGNIHIKEHINVRLHIDPKRSNTQKLTKNAQKNQTKLFLVVVEFHIVNE